MNRWKSGSFDYNKVMYGANTLVFILYCMNTMCTQIII